MLTQFCGDWSRWFLGKGSLALCYLLCNNLFLPFLLPLPPLFFFELQNAKRMLGTVQLMEEITTNSLTPFFIIYFYFLLLGGLMTLCPTPFPVLV